MSLPEDHRNYFNKQAGETILQKRLYMRLTQQELAEKLSVGFEKPIFAKTIYSWEHNKAKVPSWVLLATIHLAKNT